MKPRLVDAVAHFAHYEDHIRPIWDALPKELRGTFHPIGRHVPDPNRVCLTAGWVDVRTMAQHEPVFYVEHGSGQTYQGDPNPAIAHHPSYSASGGERFPNVLGYICPSIEVAKRWDNAPAVAVGCPKMDRYWGLEPRFPMSVCFTFHWPGTLCPENGTAFWDYEPCLADTTAALQAIGITVFGHAHPRWDGFLWPYLEKAGMVLLHTDREVFERAAMLVADNTSLIPEFASLGRPVMLLDAIHYRRDIWHGGRFWRWPQLVAELPLGGKDHLADLIEYHLLRPAARADSLDLTAEVYAFNDGHASERAAAFIVERLLEM